MPKIIHKEELAPKTTLLEFDLPAVAAKAQPGQFVLLRVDEEGERIPLTIADYNREKGSLTVVVQEAGATSAQLAHLEVGMSVAGIAGPLGRPSHIENWGTVVCVGGGVGIACVHPIARACKEKGNRLISIIGGRSRENLIFQDRLGRISDRLLVMTDDGSAGEKGFVTDALDRILEGGEKVDFVFAVGPAPMMAAVAESTRSRKIPTWVSLNPIMVDGTGMCGGCRVTVGGEVKFACVDGPEFDAHKVDFEELISRQKMYHKEEEEACRLRRAKELE